MDATSTALYTVRDDRRTILDDDGTVDEEFLWSIRDGTLELLDARGFVYVFRAPIGDGARPDRRSHARQRLISSTSPPLRGPSCASAFPLRSCC